MIFVHLYFYQMIFLLVDRLIQHFICCFNFSSFDLFSNLLLYIANGIFYIRFIIVWFELIQIMIILPHKGCNKTVPICQYTGSYKEIQAQITLKLLFTHTNSFDSLITLGNRMKKSVWDISQDSTVSGDTNA